MFSAVPALFFLVILIASYTTAVLLPMCDVCTVLARWFPRFRAPAGSGGLLSVDSPDRRSATGLDPMYVKGVLKKVCTREQAVGN